MVAGARDRGGPLGEAGQVLEGDDDLRVERDTGGDVEDVARDREEVDPLGLGQDPVELAKVVVEVRDEERPHRSTLSRLCTFEACRRPDRIAAWKLA